MPRWQEKCARGSIAEVQQASLCTLACNAHAAVADHIGLRKRMSHDPNRASAECEVSRTVQQIAC
jgi:hypothetical protein